MFHSVAGPPRVSLRAVSVRRAFGTGSLTAARDKVRGHSIITGEQEREGKMDKFPAAELRARRTASSNAKSEYVYRRRGAREKSLSVGIELRVLFADTVDILRRGPMCVDIN